MAPHSKLLFPASLIVLSACGREHVFEVVKYREAVQELARVDSLFDYEGIVRASFSMEEALLWKNWDECKAEVENSFDLHRKNPGSASAEVYTAHLRHGSLGEGRGVRGMTLVVERRSQDEIWISPNGTIRHLEVGILGWRRPVSVILSKTESDPLRQVLEREPSVEMRIEPSEVVELDVTFGYFHDLNYPKGNGLIARMVSAEREKGFGNIFGVYLTRDAEGELQALSIEEFGGWRDQ